MHNKTRYLMFTQKNLYTLTPEHYDSGALNKKKLIKNTINLEFFDYMMLIPSRPIHMDEIDIENDNDIEMMKNQY